MFVDLKPIYLLYICFFIFLKSRRNYLVNGYIVLVAPYSKYSSSIRYCWRSIISFTIACHCGFFFVFFSSILHWAFQKCNTIHRWSNWCKVWILSHQFCKFVDTSQKTQYEWLPFCTVARTVSSSITKKNCFILMF